MLARQLARLPQLAKRLTAGELSYGYASVIGGAVRRLDDDDAAKAETILLELVDAGCTVKEITAVGERITMLIAERDDTAPSPRTVGAAIGSGGPCTAPAAAVLSRKACFLPN